MNTEEFRNGVLELIGGIFLWLLIAAFCWVFAVATPAQYTAESDMARAETEGRAE